MPAPTGTATSHLITLIEDYHSLNPSQPPLLTYPTPLEFSKQVSKGLPCVYALPKTADLKLDSGNILYTWPALTWTSSSLTSQVTSPVDVAVTPDGRADSLYSLPGQSSDSGETEKVFLQPATIQVSMSTLLDKLRPSITSQPGPVHYLQSQNSNLTSTSLAPLLSDLPPNIPFAEEVLGQPEAINIWIGDQRSVTSTHRDPYENLYLVLTGAKTFTLYSPLDEVALHAQHVRTGRWVYHPHHSISNSRSSSPPSPFPSSSPFSSQASKPSHSFSIRLDDDDEKSSPRPNFHTSASSPSTSEPVLRLDPDFASVPVSVSASDKDKDTDSTTPNSQNSRNTIPWIPISPSPFHPRHELNTLYPLYAHAQPQTVTVSAGHILYLPAGWFHHVTQSCGDWPDGSPAPCIAVNYWYDQDYEGEKYATRQLIGRLVAQAQEEQKPDVRSSLD